MYRGENRKQRAASRRARVPVSVRGVACVPGGPCARGFGAPPVFRRAPVGRPVPRKGHVRQSRASVYRGGDHRRAVPGACAARGDPAALRRSLPQGGRGGGPHPDVVGLLRFRAGGARRPAAGARAGKEGRPRLGGRPLRQRHRGGDGAARPALRRGAALDDRRADDAGLGPGLLPHGAPADSRGDPPWRRALQRRGGIRKPRSRGHRPRFACGICGHSALGRARAGAGEREFIDTPRDIAGPRACRRWPTGWTQST